MADLDPSRPNWARLTALRGIEHAIAEDIVFCAEKAVEAGFPRDQETFNDAALWWRRNVRAAVAAARAEWAGRL